VKWILVRYGVSEGSETPEAHNAKCRAAGRDSTGSCSTSRGQKVTSTTNLRTKSYFTNPLASYMYSRIVCTLLLLQSSREQSKPTVSSRSL
jgi:hypothetical protein